MEKSPPHGSSDSPLAALPKAELHVHLEGCLTPELVVELARSHGEKLEIADAAARYQTRTFAQFVELFKWATSYLREPKDYARLSENFLQQFSAPSLRYAEITLAIGVMPLRRQDPEANFQAIAETFARAARSRPLRVQFIFDAVRQFGPEKAMEVARIAARMKSAGVIAFGIGGDENSLPASQFCEVFEFAASAGLHRVAHAGETGTAGAVRDAIEILGAERIGHGIASIQDEGIMQLLRERNIPLEICLHSNLRTGALAQLLGGGKLDSGLKNHPLKQFVECRVPVTLSSDDPAMFGTTLELTYAAAHQQIGISARQLTAIAEAGFAHAFLPAAEKQKMLDEFRSEARALDLL